MINSSQIPIGKFSLMTQLTPKTLRFYDKRGLLIPEEKDPLTGYRYYTLSQVEEGIKIKMLTWMGFDLDNIAKILAAVADGDKDQLKNLFSRRLAETQLEIERLKKVEEVLLDKEKIYEMIYVHTTEPVIKNAPALRVISWKAIGDYNIVAQLVEGLIREITTPQNQRNFVKIAGPVIYICHDTEFKESGAELEIAIPVSGRIMVQNDRIELHNIPGGPVASSIYTGPYNEISPAYTRLYEYVISNNYEMRGPAMEFYLNNPMETPEEELLTEIQFPIKLEWIIGRKTNLLLWFFIKSDDFSQSEKWRKLDLVFTQSACHLVSMEFWRIIFS